MIFDILVTILFQVISAFVSYGFSGHSSFTDISVFCEISFMVTFKFKLNQVLVTFHFWGHLSFGEFSFMVTF